MMIDLPPLIEQCNLGAPQEVVQAIIQVESAGKPLALGINPPQGREKPDLSRYKTPEALAAQADALIAQGYSVDVGLMQVNSQNLARFGVPVIAAFEPCKNIELGTRIYLEHAAEANQVPAEFFPGKYARLQATLSAYNTGSFWAGIKNGYVGRVMQTIKYGFDPHDASPVVDFQLTQKVDGNEITVPFDFPASDWSSL